MLLEIDYHSGEPIYRQIIRQIRQQIMAEGLKTGDQLDAVRDLAERLKVNPMTVSKAYSFMEAEGLVERKRGVGLFVAPIPKSKRDQMKIQSLENILEKAAIAAVQLGVSEEETLEFFRKCYRDYDAKNRRLK
jgi:GntR family transcriptional regulator